MYFTALPIHAAPSFDEAAHFAAFRRRNIIFNAEVRRSFCEKHVGCLSLKTVFTGEEWYGVGGAPVAVRPNRFLLLNQDQVYASRIESPQPVRSFSLFFQPDFAATVLADTQLGEEQLVDDPALSAGKMEFYQKLYEVDAGLHSQLRDLLRHLEAFGYSPSLADERLGAILAHLVRRHRSQRAATAKVGALKASTRAEIFKRLCVAKDVLYSLYEQPVELAQVSRYAGLSLPQLIRHFKGVFGCTPHQYLTQVRLEQARHLLRHSPLGLADITLAVGLSDPSAFCRLFRQWHGCTPESFRQGRR